MMDVSGSMDTFKKYIARSFYFWMVQFLRRTYEAVPPSTEYSWLDFDLALSELLANDRARD